MQVLYKTIATATGERDGQAKSSDGILDADLFVSLPGLDKETAEKLVNRAHEEVCPYSNATRNNVDVRLHVST